LIKRGQIVVPHAAPENQLVRSGHRADRIKLQAAQIAHDIEQDFHGVRGSGGNPRLIQALASNEEAASRFAGDSAHGRKNSFAIKVRGL
jgi:hypothetical protein